MVRTGADVHPAEASPAPPALSSRWERRRLGRCWCRLGRCWHRLGHLLDERGAARCLRRRAAERGGDRVRAGGQRRGRERRLAGLDGHDAEDAVTVGDRQRSAFGQPVVVASAERNPTGANPAPPTVGVTVAVNVTG